MGDKTEVNGGEDRPEASVGRLEHWLNPTVLRGIALGAAVAALLTFGLAIFAAEDFTGAWGTATVALLALAASLFSAAASTATVQSGRRSADAAVTSAQAATTSAASGERSADAATSSAQSGERSAEAAADSAAAAQRAYGQQLYELARATHHDLTTGEVAAARDLLGTIGRRRKAFWPPEVQVDDVEPLGEWLRSRGYASAEEQLEDTRRAWFTLLWCFQRIRAARQLLERAEAQAPPAASDESPRRFLDDLVRNQVRFLNSELSHARAAVEEFFEEPLDDRDSAEAFRELVEILLAGEKDEEGKEVAPGRWSLPVATHAGEVLRILLLDSGPRSPLPEDLAASQYQALWWHLDRPDDLELFEVDRRLLAEKLRARRNDLERPGGPERTAISKNPRSGGELDMWASTYSDPTQRSVPRTWDTP